jgi:hypothetical protein
MSYSCARPRVRCDCSLATGWGRRGPKRCWGRWRACRGSRDCTWWDARHCTHTRTRICPRAHTHTFAPNARSHTCAHACAHSTPGAVREAVLRLRPNVKAACESRMRKLPAKAACENRMRKPPATTACERRRLSLNRMPAARRRPAGRGSGRRGARGEAARGLDPRPRLPPRPAHSGVFEVGGGGRGCVPV